MKSFLRRSAGILAASLVFCGLAATSEAGGHGGKGKKEPPKIPYTAIVSVDTSAMTITVGPKNTTATGTKTYKFTPKTVITVDGKPGTVASLTPGQQIHIGAGADPDIADELKVTAPPAEVHYAGHDKP